MPFFRLHVHEWNSGAIYEDGFTCPEDTLVYEVIQTVLGKAEFARLISLKFGEVTVTNKTTFADLGMIECRGFYNFHVRLMGKAGEPHNFGMDYRIWR